MRMSQGVSRRQFLCGVAGLGVAAPYVIAGRVFADPPSEKIITGHIGVGGMGGNHLGAMLDRCAAVCDVDERCLNGAAARVRRQVGVYKDYRKLLERKDIDGVVIATPDHWHALTSIHTMEAGKDVYCEKPMTLTIQEGQAMVRTARRYGRVFQTGSQQRSSQEFYLACMLVRNGRIGRLERIGVGLGGNPTCDWAPDEPTPKWIDWDMWLGQAPLVPYNPRRHPGAFRFIWDYSGGCLCDWGAHHLDTAQWGNGTSHTGPVEIDGKGNLPDKGIWDTPTSYEVKYKYANGVAMIAGGTQRGGVTFYGTKGWVYVDRGQFDSEPKALAKEKFGPGDEQLYTGFDINPSWSGTWIKPSHHNNWFECIKTRKRCIADVEIGHRSISIAHLGNISIRLKRPLKWDPDKEQIIGDDEANRMVGRAMRQPWHL